MIDLADNMALYIYYAVFIIGGALFAKKRRFVGAVVGGLIATGLLTFLAFRLGG